MAVRKPTRARAVITSLVLVLGLLVFALWRTVSASRPAADSAPAASDTADKRPPPAPLPSVPIASSGAGGERSVPPAVLDERHLMERLRAIKDQDRAAAVELAREGNRRFPDSSSAPERASILIHALAMEGQASQARGEAEFMVNHYPDSSWVREVEQFSGAHRHRNLSLNDAGQIVSH